MKAFIIRSLIALLLALLLAVGVFLYVQFQFIQPTTPTPVPEPITQPSAVSETTEVVATDEVPAQPATVAEKAVTEPESEAQPVVASREIPLSSLPLSESQLQLIRGVGIDPDTFVITEAMIVCAETKLGDQRYGEIVGGSTPTFTEITGLLGCLE